MDQLWSLLGALLFVLLLIYGLAMAARRLRQAPMSAGIDVRVVGSTYLGPRDRLVVVRFHDQELLLSVGQNPVTLLASGERTAQTASPGSDEPVQSQEGIAAGLLARWRRGVE